MDLSFFDRRCYKVLSSNVRFITDFCSLSSFSATRYISIKSRMLSGSNNSLCSLMCFSIYFFRLDNPSLLDLRSSIWNGNKIQYILHIYDWQSNNSWKLMYRQDNYIWWQILAFITWFQWLTSTTTTEENTLSFRWLKTRDSILT